MNGTESKLLNLLYVVKSHLIIIRRTIFFVDKTTRRIISILAGRKDDSSSLSDFHAAEQHFREARAASRFTPKQKCHRRGRYASVTYGYSFGGGQKVSTDLFVM